MLCTDRDFEKRVVALYISRRVLVRRVGIRAMKFETARILFLGEVFAAVAVFVAYGR